MRVVAITTLALFCLLSLTLSGVYYNRNFKKPSYHITLPAIVGTEKEFRTENIEGAYVIHVFASWCATCLEEHKIWMSIANEKPIRVYGVAYLDVQHKTLEWLAKHGNPYAMVAADYSGRVMKKLGVIGVPETLVFSRTGEMVMHVSGAMTEDLWKRIFTLVS
ncbi:DsbE family thiol:disulfide interchange protein [Anaplasma marginale]|uniref:Thiol:disulfide interchange protein (DsbE) n=1 Tax=Anaplasma marginale (strain Florida) TaxID=320483 RepID=B9KHP1_ANAMF|nr:DsbE family thiol:disulfide interchange protein [Anaplasma marginale]ACM49003.1 Thiol:disulfide interchange protein (dsbE) [Anaplasma marginale str. Florida]RCL19529.1 DsbE family thiol:disulfide interchange protein [Anaplasma marginale]TZF78116.1 DsbE family thiol:disulfide interchange protein [Anaplasma marginale]